MTDPENLSMRVSDEERAAVAERLRVATNEGRLRVDEYDDRLGRAYSAATRADLVPLTADLPEPTPGEAPAEVAEKKRNREKLSKEWRGWASTSLILVGVWGVTSLASGDLAFFWPVFPVGIWAIVLVAGTVFGFGDSSGDEDDDEGDGSDTRHR